MNDLNKEMHEYYKRQNDAERWGALLFLGWVAFMAGLVILTLLLS